LGLEDPGPPELFGGANVNPGNFTLATIAGFLPSPEEGASPLVDGLDNTSGEKAGAHGMGKHRCQDRVNEKESPSDGKASPSPAEKPHVALGHDRSKISETELVRG
jgi:hypothetical protein